MTNDFKERTLQDQWWTESESLRETSANRYAQAPDVLDPMDNEPEDVDWDSPGGYSGDPLETPKHPAYRRPTRWQGTTLEAMGF